MTQNSEKEFWLEWLQMYKSHKCLWDPNTKEYISRPRRQQAHADLAYLARTIHPEADENWVRTRINTLRTNYRRERKRVISARERGEPYEPTLFYYNLLDEILGDTVTAKDAAISNRNIQKIEVEEEDYDNEDANSNAHSEEAEDEDPFTVEEIEEHITKTKQPRKKRRKMVKPNNQKSYNYENYQSPQPSPSMMRFVQPVFEDDCELLGRRLASHFRNMDINQRLIAEKIISEVCVYGRMGQLNMETSVVVATPNE